MKIHFAFFTTLIKCSLCWFFSSEEEPKDVFVDFTNAYPAAIEQAARSYKIDDILGVPFSKQDIYKTKFVCKNSDLSPTFVSPDKINDNYCDCPDCSDEPGTSAFRSLKYTPQKFYCPNVRYKSIFVDKSKVNDQICDCCDGSDELTVKYNKEKNLYEIDFDSLTCENKCEELGVEYMKRKEAEEKSLVEGRRKKEDMLRHGKERKDELIKELEEKKKELEKLQEELRTVTDEVSSLKSLSSSASGSDSSSRKLTEKEEENLIKERIDALQLKKLTRKDLEFILVKLATRSHIGDRLEDLVITKIKPRDEDEGPFWIESEQDDYYAEDYYGSDYEDEGNSAEVKAAEKEKKDLERKVRAAEKEQKDMQNQLELDVLTLGAEGNCVEKELGEYKYNVCFLKDAKQGRTSLGKFDKIEVQGDQKIMLFKDGQKCFNGIKRNLKVELTCGGEDDIVSVSEPSVCSYVAVVKSPLGC
eukprot:maker-scaffold_14-snap-gene-0.3-mRNA-1 protein AED:0.02 eAED:0.02 QI:89/1/1/1/0.66/0.75/4/353/472